MLGVRSWCCAAQCTVEDRLCVPAGGGRAYASKCCGSAITDHSEATSGEPKPGRSCGASALSSGLAKTSTWPNTYTLVRLVSGVSASRPHTAALGSEGAISESANVISELYGATFESVGAISESETSVSESLAVPSAFGSPHPSRAQSGRRIGRPCQSTLRLGQIQPARNRAGPTHF